MGPPASGVECGSAHIGGAKSIRLDEYASRDDRCPPFGIGLRLSAWAVITARATHMRDAV